MCADVTIVGAGIVGLCSALRLTDIQPSLCLAVIANKFTSDTTSHGAAGIFRPAESFIGPDPAITLNWIRESFDYYQRLLKEDCGVSEISGYIFSNTSASVTRNCYLEGLVPEYRLCTEEELIFNGKKYKYGCFFTTLLIECSRFLPWATAKLKDRGVSFQRETVYKLDDLRYRTNVIINCTGLGAKEICKDSLMVPIRGQVLKINAPWLDKFYYLDVDTYIIPTRPLITVGGSRHYDSHTTVACDHDAAAILERATDFLPRLSSADVVRRWTGLRPHRQRVRCEISDSDLASGLKVVHNYGHGGYGVTAAPGTGLHAAKIALNLLYSKSKL